MKPFFSIVIPVYNRAWCLARTLHSAIEFLISIGGGQIVVIDDGSTDGSLKLAMNFANSLENKLIDWRICYQSNKGVCAAKNAGAKVASGEWIIFLDSDDELLVESAVPMKNFIENNSNSPLHFFRCINEHNCFVGSQVNDNLFLDLDKFILDGTQGESLPVVARSIFLDHMYDDDISGFEGLSYARIIRNVSPAILNTLIARRYYTNHVQRLSSKASLSSRRRSISKGYWRMYCENRNRITMSAALHLLMRYFYHRVRSIRMSSFLRFW